MNSEILELLRKPLPVYEKPGKGHYSYFKSSDVIDRMNKTFHGDWSTEVIEHTQVGDEIVVHVRVFATPNGHTFHHDGFGSAKVFPGTDIGNVYKSAEAKAIRNACSRWGVGLDFLEVDTEPEEGNRSFSVPTMKSEGAPLSDSITVPSTINSPSVPKEGPAFIAPSFPAPTPAIKKAPQFPIPSIGGNSTTANNSQPPIPKVGVDNDTTINSPMAINDVQKTAIEAILTTKSLKYEDLLSEALGDLAASKKLEDLSYQEAVKIIKCGNDKNRIKK